MPLSASHEIQPSGSSPSSKSSADDSTPSSATSTDSAVDVSRNGSVSTRPPSSPHGPCRRRSRRSPNRPFAEVSPVPRDCSIDGLRVSIDSRTAWYGDRKLPLSQMEFGLLVALAREPTRVYTKAELLRDVWDYRGRGVPRTVDTHASRLRRKLVAAGAPTGRFVRCLWGVGYSLTCPA